MSPTWSHLDAKVPQGSTSDLDDAEKGLHDQHHERPMVAVPRLAHVESDEKLPRPLHIETATAGVMSPMSPIHDGLTPFATVPPLALQWPRGSKFPGAPPYPYGEDPRLRKPDQPPLQVTKWIKFKLWYNTYRKFFTFVTLLNLAGIICAALGKFQYAEKHMGALVLGNLLFAILMRNELFLRLLYIIVIHGLRFVSFTLYLCLLRIDGRVSLIPNPHHVNSGLQTGSSMRSPRCCSTSAGSIPAAHCREHAGSFIRLSTSSGPGRCRTRR
jgi:hypothetical protein